MAAGEAMAEAMARLWRCSFKACMGLPWLEKVPARLSRAAARRGEADWSCGLATRGVSSWEA